MISRPQLLDLLPSTNLIAAVADGAVTARILAKQFIFMATWIEKPPKEKVKTN